MFFLYNLDQSNWMRFVRPADSVIEQNLVLSQEGNHLFYTTTRSIEPKEELRVTYSEEYARMRGLELFTSSDPQNIFDRGRKIVTRILSKFDNRLKVFIIHSYQICILLQSLKIKTIIL